MHDEREQGCDDADEPVEETTYDVQAELIELRRRQTAALVARGLVRRGPDGELVRLPILAFTGREGDDPERHFLAVDGRIVVPAADLDEVHEILGDGAGTVSRLNDTFALVELRGVGVVDALDRLAEVAPALVAAPQHLVFSAYRAKGQEGDDPEPVDPSVVGEPPAGPLPGTGVTVAVVDTGVAEEALDDPWLERIKPQEADLDPLRERETGVDPRDGAAFQDLEAGHGTMVIGVLRTVAPGCSVEVIRALDSDGNATDDEIARGIDEAVRRGADIINLSLGGLTDRNLPPPVIEDAIHRVPPEVIVVAAAGNFFTDRPTWPGAIRRVVSVAALDQQGNEPAAVHPRLAPYSSFGWWVDVAAAGHWATTFVTGRENPERETQGPPDQFEGYAEAKGTSLAAAAVAGALAVDLAALRQAAESEAALTVSARLALGSLLGRPGNVRLPHGTVAIDVWNDEGDVKP